MTTSKQKEKYPESEKLQEVANVHTTLHQFNEWLNDKGYEIVHFENGRRPNYAELIYQFMEVNEKELEKERRQMLESARNKH